MILLQQYIILKKKGIKIGFLGYCYLYTGGCSAVRKMYKAGPAIYRDHIAQRDVRQLKVCSVTNYKYLGAIFGHNWQQNEKIVNTYFAGFSISIQIIRILKLYTQIKINKSNKLK